MKASPRLLVAIACMQALTLLGQWTGQPKMATDAQAAIPDPGAQREATVAELRTVNAKLDQLIALLSSGEVKVTVEDPAKK